MNFLPGKKYGVPSHNFVKKNVLCEKGDEITRFDGTSFEIIYFYRSLLKGDLSAKLCDSDEETQGSRRIRCMNVFLWMSTVYERKKYKKSGISPINLSLKGKMLKKVLNCFNNMKHCQKDDCNKIKKPSTVSHLFSASRM